MYQIYILLEVRGPSGPQLVVGGPSGRLDFVLRALGDLFQFLGSQRVPIFTISDLNALKVRAGTI